MGWSHEQGAVLTQRRESTSLPTGKVRLEGYEVTVSWRAERSTFQKGTALATPRGDSFDYHQWLSKFGTWGWFRRWVWKSRQGLGHEGFLLVFFFFSQLNTFYFILMAMRSHIKWSNQFDLVTNWIWGKGIKGGLLYFFILFILCVWHNFFKIN